MTRTEQIKSIVEQIAAGWNQSLTTINRDWNRAFAFWCECADQYIKIFDCEDADPRYRFDKEWQEFWDEVETLYPKYIKKGPVHK